MTLTYTERKEYRIFDILLVLASVARLQSAHDKDSNYLKDQPRAN